MLDKTPALFHFNRTYDSRDAELKTRMRSSRYLLCVVMATAIDSTPEKRSEKGGESIRLLKVR